MDKPYEDPGTRSALQQRLDQRWSELTNTSRMADFRSLSAADFWCPSWRKAARGQNRDCLGDRWMRTRLCWVTMITCGLLNGLQQVSCST